MAKQHDHSSHPGMTELEFSHPGRTDLELSHVNTHVYEEIPERVTDAHTYADIGASANHSSARTNGYAAGGVRGDMSKLPANLSGRTIVVVVFGVLVVAAVFSVITGYVVYHITSAEIDKLKQALDAKGTNNATSEPSATSEPNTTIKPNSLSALLQDMAILKTKLPPLSETLKDTKRQLDELEHVVSNNHSDIYVYLETIEYQLNEVNEMASSNHSETVAHLDTLEGVVYELEEKLNASGQHVAFAVHTPTGELNGGPTFEHVILNMGDGYNQDTGTFICPSAGVYLFAFSLLTTVSRTDRVACALYKNKVRLLGTAYSQEGRMDAASVTVVVHMDVGDQLNLVVYNWKDGASKTHHTLYMGVLVTAD